MIEDYPGYPMGFVANTDLLLKLINLIALPLNDQCEFDEIVLHFDEKREELWWSNKCTDGNYLVNFGHATYDYFDECWGEGEVALSASSLLGILQEGKKDKVDQILLGVCPELGTHEIIFDDGEFIQSSLAVASEINTHKPRVDYARNNSNYPYKLDNDYIPILPEALEYGGTINARDLKTVVATGRKLRPKRYPMDFRIKPKPPLTEPLTVTFNGRKPNQCIEIKIKGKSLRPPNVDISQIISNKLEAPALALNGNITLRLSMDNTSPIYLLKEEKHRYYTNGEMKAGMLIGTKKNLPKAR